jgi:Astacin (Peptidase family M12A)/FG-GAP-like repeat
VKKYKMPCRVLGAGTATLALSVLMTGCSTNPYSPPQQSSVTLESMGIKTASVALPNTTGPSLVRYEVINGKAIFQGDIVLGDVDVSGKIINRLTTQGLARDIDSRWIGGVIPYIIDSTVSSSGVNNTLAAIAAWNNSPTPIRLVQRTTQADYVVFTRGARPEACSANFGRVGGVQYIDLSSAGDCGVGPTIHEIGHVVGFGHEQSRPDRDNFVTIQTSNILPLYLSQFDKYGSEAIQLGSYDYNSIMHYPAYAFAIDKSLPTITTKNGAVFGQQIELSSGDLNSTNLLYSFIRPSFDLVGIKKTNTGANSVEVHVTGAPSNYQNFKYQSGSAASNDPSQSYFLNYYDKDNKPDLIKIIRPSSVVQNMIVQIFSGSSNHQIAILNTTLPISYGSSQFDTQVIDFNNDGKLDIVSIKRNDAGSNSVELHVMDGATGFQSFLTQVGTVFAVNQPSSTKFRLADWDGDNRPDLISIPTQNTGTGKVEVHIATAASNYRQFTLHTGTALSTIDSDANWDFDMGDFNKDGRPDLIGIRKNNTQTGRAELHVLSGANNFQSFVAQTGTAFPQDVGSNWIYSAVKSY